MNRIYLAGKVRGRKWELIEDIKNIKFTCSEVYNDIESCIADLILFREANKQKKRENGNKS